MKTAGNQTLTAADSQTSSITGLSGTIVVSAAVATHFTVKPSATSITAGTNVVLTVTALDQFNNTATGYTGTATFTSTDTGASTIIPTPHTLTAGLGTFNATLTTAGSQSVTATDANTSGVTGTITGSSGTLTVSAAAATHLSISGAPTTAIAGVSFTFTLTSFDQFNNVAKGYAGTVAFTTNDAAATKPANSKLTSGVGTFSATLKTAGNTFLTATDTVTSSLTASIGPIAVSAATATHLALTAPTNATAGTGFNLTVTAYDQFNNIATTYAGVVQYTTTDPHVIQLPTTNTTFLASDNGQHVFASGVVLATSATTQTVTGTDVNNPGVNAGTTAPITVSPVNANHLVVTGPNSATAGVSFNITVMAEDTFFNVVPTYSGTVTFSAFRRHGGQFRAKQRHLDKRRRCFRGHAGPCYKQRVHHSQWHRRCLRPGAQYGRQRGRR